MSQRKIGFDRANLDGKISEDDKWLMAEAVIASEIVHEYPEGMAYKPAEELEKAAWTADGRWVTILKHPDSALLQKASDIYGKVENPIFVKNLMDAKTKRPCRKGIRATVKWRKDLVPQTIQDKIKSGELRDVSVGFTYAEDRTPGEWEGEKYDYVQRNIFIDHLAAPVETGRCPGPICGIGVDSIAIDPEENEESIRIPTGSSCEVTATISISEEEGIQALYCGEEKKVRTFIFAKSKGWNMEKAQSWVNEHKGDSFKVKEDDCPICQAINKVGLLSTANRLLAAYGKDIILVIQGEKTLEMRLDEDLIVRSNRVFKELASLLNS